MHNQSPFMTSITVAGSLLILPLMMGQQQCTPSDIDGDEWSVEDGDCDDTNADVYPGAQELCDGTDNNCDGLVDEGVEGATADCAALDCWSLIAANPNTTDGYYWIDPAMSGDPSYAFCDMSTDGGGWTLVQRTVWAWAESSQLMTGYASWYGTTVGSPEEGYAYRLKGELWGYLNVDLEHLLVHEARDVGSSASCAPLYYKGTDGIYTVTSATTTLDGLQSSVVMTNATELSTQDSGPSTVCTQSPSYAVPWFYSYCCTTCPTFMGGYWTDEPHPMASYIASSPDLYGQVEASVCPSGAALYGAGYAGINSMEYYIR